MIRRTTHIAHNDSFASDDNEMAEVPSTQEGIETMATTREPVARLLGGYHDSSSSSRSESQNLPTDLSLDLDSEPGVDFPTLLTEITHPEALQPPVSPANKRTLMSVAESTASLPKQSKGILKPIVGLLLMVGVAMYAYENFPWRFGDLRYA